MAVRKTAALKPLSRGVRDAIARGQAGQGNDVKRERGELLVFAQTTDAGDELFIYGDIGDYWWSDESNSGIAIAEKLAGLSGKKLTLRINSYGGVVDEGVAIYNNIRLHKKRTGAEITARVDGIAASIASLISQAADIVVMPANTIMMIHAPWTFCAGSASQLEKMAGDLRKYEDASATSYTGRSGLTEDEFKAQYYDDQDHYLTAAEAVEAGFADQIEDASAEPAIEDPAVAAALQRISAKAESLSAGVSRFAAAAGLAFASALKPLASQSTPNPSPASADIHQPAVAGESTGANSMTPEEIKAAAKKAAGEALASLRARNAEISALASPHFGNADVKALHDQIIGEADPDVTAADVGKRILAILAKGAGPLNGNAAVVAGADERDKVKSAMKQAIMSRSGMEKSEGANPFRGFTLAEMARDCLVRAGVQTAGLERREIVGLAFTHSSSDFPGILGDTGNAAVLRGYQEAEENIEAISRAISVSDFKPTSLLGLGIFSDLLVVQEGGEFKYGTFSEQSQSIQLITYGRLFSITRQAIINDQLSLFSDVGRKMGMAAKRTVANAVWNLLASNPTLADGFALFSAQHHNLLTAAAISTTSVDAMRASMALQKGPDGEAIRVPLKTLATPIALGGLARTVRESQTEVSGSKNLTTPNIVRGTFDVVDDGRLDAVSATSWFGIADPNVIDGIVVGYLDGNQEPYTEQHEGFTVDGIAYKVRLDAAAAVADYRGLAKNPGA